MTRREVYDRAIITVPLIAFAVGLAFTSAQNAAGIAFLSWVALGGIGRLAR